LTTTDVLQQFQTTLNDVSSTKQFSNEVLVYVTPWNRFRFYLFNYLFPFQKLNF